MAAGLSLVVAPIRHKQGDSMKLTKADIDALYEQVKREMENAAMYKGLTNGHSYKVWELPNDKTKGTTMAEIVKAVMWLCHSEDLSILSVTIDGNVMVASKLQDKLWVKNGAPEGLEAHECAEHIVKELCLPCCMVWISSNQQPVECIEVPLFMIGDEINIDGEYGGTIVAVERTKLTPSVPYTYTLKSGVKLNVYADSGKDGEYTAYTQDSDKDSFQVSKKAKGDAQ